MQLDGCHALLACCGSIHLVSPLASPQREAVAPRSGALVASNAPDPLPRRHWNEYCKIPLREMVGFRAPNYYNNPPIRKVRQLPAGAARMERHLPRPGTAACTASGPFLQSHFIMASACPVPPDTPLLLHTFKKRPHPTAPSQPHPNRRPCLRMATCTTPP